MKKFRQYLKEKLEKEEGSQLGSNDGGIHRDTETGKRHYVKFYKNGDQAKTEVLAAKIYKHMGIHTLNPEHHVIGGRHAVSTEWNDKVGPIHKHEFENTTPHQAHQVGKMYHAAVLTKNWDIVGLTHDNILKHKETKDLHSVDQGGAFHFRAQGSHKDYTPDADEHHTLRNNTGASGHVFRNVFKQHPDAEHKGLDAVKNIDDQHVEGLFRDSGLHNWQDMHKTFKARKSVLLGKYKG